MSGAHTVAASGAPAGGTPGGSFRPGAVPTGEGGSSNSPWHDAESEIVAATTTGRHEGRIVVIGPSASQLPMPGDRYMRADPRWLPPPGGRVAAPGGCAAA